ncbi:pleckstrin homology domain-containing family F member 2 [Scophthalmus maximus]|nr:pleckstrin homology domain-containing family F member 2 [Scophthalmus maximus]
MSDFHDTMDQLTFARENRERIHAVENSFGPSGRPLDKPDRILMGEGHLMKQGRRKLEQKAFFLFNDILVYGSMVLNGRWHKKQKIIPLEDLQLEDVEDGLGLRNQWLIRTPRKSFFVSASTYEEKRAWIDHIEHCRAGLLRGSSCQPGSAFAVSWIPDRAAYKCMRCFGKFTPTRRRHHCRKCGFLVCNACSKTRAVIGHIHATKKLRVCRICHTRNAEGEKSRLSGDSTGKNSSEEDDAASSSGEEGDEETMQDYTASSWVDSRMGTWGQIGTNIFQGPTLPRTSPE